MSGKLPHIAFEFYFGLGPGRSYQTVAYEFGVSKKSVTKRATSECWQDRLAKLEEKSRQNAEKKALETLDAMNDRHLRSLRAVQGKALQAIKTAFEDGGLAPRVFYLDQVVGASEEAQPDEYTIENEPVVGGSARQILSPT